MIDHTPGPWEVRLAGGNPYAINAPCRSVINWGGFSKPSQPESLANAHLIAAAPELLDALKAVLLMLDETSSSAGVAERMRELVSPIIAKAEGRKP